MEVSQTSWPASVLEGSGALASGYRRLNPEPLTSSMHRKEAKWRMQEAGTLGASLPELFGIKHQFHIVDNGWQVFQSCSLQTKSKDCWASWSWANVNIDLQLPWRTTDIPRRETSLSRWEKETAKHHKNRANTSDPQAVLVCHKVILAHNNLGGQHILPVDPMPMLHAAFVWFPPSPSQSYSEWRCVSLRGILCKSIAFNI